MTNLSIITEDELIKRIKAKLDSKPYKSNYCHFDAELPPIQPAAYVLILGAGFSYGVVPLVNELMQEKIGDYYYPNQDGTSLERSADVQQKNSAEFWVEFNKAVAKCELPTVELDDNGLPMNPAAAYQRLFTYEGANVLFAQSGPSKKKQSFFERLQQQRTEHQASQKRGEEPLNKGEKFVKGFLRYVLDPGCEHGYGSTGRNSLNPAHIYLATLLEAQQLGQEWTTSAFCRNVFTTNFDALLQNSLQMVNLLYRITDRPEKGFDDSDFRIEEGPIHLIYTHGSILRHNPASTINELGGLANKNIEVLQRVLECRDVITIGYGGWKDGLMAALHGCKSSQHDVYWCGIDSEPSPEVASCIEDRAGEAAYVHLGKAGADGFMRALYEELIPMEFQRDPMKRYRDWSSLVWNR